MVPSTLARKFGIPLDASLLARNPPPAAIDRLNQALPPGIRIHFHPPGEPLDLVLWWPRTLENLAGDLAELTSQIRPDGAIWLVIPKKKYAATRGIRFSWQAMQQAALQTDLVDNKVASFSETDYGTRFVIRKALRYLYQPEHKP